MNHEPVLYCFECGRARPKDEMQFVSPGKKRIGRRRKLAEDRQAVLRTE